MMLTAFLFFFIGSADLIRTRCRRRMAAAGILAVWMLGTVLAVAGLGLPLVWIAVMLAISVAWLLTTSATERIRPTLGLSPVAGLIVVVLATLAFDGTAAAVSGFVVDWHASSPLAAVRAVPLPTLVLGAALVLFLGESTNIIVRAALSRKEQQRSVVLPGVAVAPQARSWSLRRQNARAATKPAAAAAADAVLVEDLKGGRSIGVIERILIVALTLSGAYVITGAVIAAKGIVRFPEISRDGPSGSKAEYFLVGSLVSWTVAFGAVGLLVISSQG